jgi:hypothetical protein
MGLEGSVVVASQEAPEQLHESPFVPPMVQDVTFDAFHDIFVISPTLRIGGLATISSAEIGTALQAPLEQP